MIAFQTEIFLHFPFQMEMFVFLSSKGRHATLEQELSSVFKNVPLKLNLNTAPLIRLKGESVEWLQRSFHWKAFPSLF